jgi:hypothetical protein
MAAPLVTWVTKDLGYEIQYDFGHEGYNFAHINLRIWARTAAGQLYKIANLHVFKEGAEYVVEDTKNSIRVVLGSGLKYLYEVLENNVIKGKLLQKISSSAYDKIFKALTGGVVVGGSLLITVFAIPTAFLLPLSCALNPNPPVECYYQDEFPFDSVSGTSTSYMSVSAASMRVQSEPTSTQGNILLGTSVCGFDHAPVCGYDGRTYFNECMARYVGVGIAYAGKCNVSEFQDTVCLGYLPNGLKTKSCISWQNKTWSELNNTDVIALRCAFSPVYCSGPWDPYGAKGDWAYVYSKSGDGREWQLTNTNNGCGTMTLRNTGAYTVTMDWTAINWVYCHGSQPKNFTLLSSYPIIRQVNTTLPSDVQSQVSQGKKLRCKHTDTVASAVTGAGQGLVLGALAVGICALIPGCFDAASAAISKVIPGATTAGNIAIAVGATTAVGALKGAVFDAEKYYETGCELNPSCNGGDAAVETSACTLQGSSISTTASSKLAAAAVGVNGRIVVKPNAADASTNLDTDALKSCTQLSVQPSPTTEPNAVSSHDAGEQTEPLTAVDSNGAQPGFGVKKDSNLIQAPR